MDSNRRFVSLTVLALAGALTLGGCKSSNNSEANNQQPAPAAQPATAPAPDQSAASQPAAQPASATQPMPASPSAQPAPVPEPPPAPTVIVLPAGTHIAVSLDQDLGSKISQPGQSFNATVSKPVIVDGQTIIPVGAHAMGTVTDAKELGKIKGEARLSVTLNKVRTKWGSYPVNTGTIDEVQKGKGKRTAAIGGGSAAGGAIIGGIAGGGKGALIGGLIGGAAGTAGSAFTGNKQIVLPAETVLTFKLQSSVKIVQEP